jgi:hypothetical protein
MQEGFSFYRPALKDVLLLRQDSSAETTAGGQDNA